MRLTVLAVMAGLALARAAAADEGETERDVITPQQGGLPLLVDTRTGRTWRLSALDAFPTELLWVPIWFLPRSISPQPKGFLPRSFSRQLTELPPPILPTPQSPSKD